MDQFALRVTPLTVAPDIAPAVARYEALGFGRVETGDAECVGMRAGASYAILTTTARFGADFGAAEAERLSGTTLSYVHVASTDEAVERLPASARILADVRTGGGTRELLVEDGEDRFILAEKLAF